MYAIKRRGISEYNAVSSTANETRDPHELVKLLFIGLTDRIAMARAALAKGDREARASAVTKSQKILFGLRDSLDFDAGGELASNLDSLYEYSIRLLTRAHAREDDKIFSEVMDLMVGIRDAWQEIPTTKNLSRVQ
jgi:flagellar protein FliS|tara:strand:+ start:1270 stop:1677 length:408 start_codon:yes stop_codon:yes gene_type:complete